MPLNTVDTLSVFAQEYLAAVLAALATTDAGVPDGPAYVAPGIPSLDCPEMVTVHVQTLQFASTSPSAPLAADQRAARRGLIQATLVAQFVRCQPTIKGTSLPNAVEMNAAGKKADQDVWAVWNHIVGLVRAGTIFEGACPPNGIDPPAPITPQGASAGWAFQVRPQIGGYPA